MQRIWIIFFTLCLLYGGIVARLFYWQIIHGNELKNQALAQYAKRVTLQSKRGAILFSDGSPFVLNQPSYHVYADPYHILDKRYFASQISSILQSVSESEVFENISVPNRRWVGIAKRVTEEKQKELERLDLKGLGFHESEMRFYPEASMGAHLLGFVGQDSHGNDKGYFGLEGYYDRELSGKEGMVFEERDGRGRQILFGDAERIDPEHGRTLVVWIDRSIQFSVEKRLLEGIQKYGAEKGIVMVMDPKTGGILAMASFPNYDPFRYYEFHQDLYKNPAVAMSYEPGSTFKPLIMAAGINEKSIAKDTTYNETGPVRIGIYSIRTWDDRYRNLMTMTDVLKYSSNVGMVFVAKQLGNSSILQYIQTYGFGEKTGIDLEDETSPTLRKPGTWTDIDYATSSFGQGIAVTPIQLIRAIAALANDGVLMEPHVVKEIRDASGKSIIIKPKEVRRVVSKETAAMITDMMVDAAKYGEAKWAAPKGYKIAGKTGTAQIPVAGHYDEERTIASFVGFAPADDPRFVMLVILHEPKTSQWGSETAAPLFFQIAKDILNYLGIPPRS